MKQNAFTNFSGKAILVFTITLGIHLLTLKWLGLPLFAHHILLAYGVNLSLVILIFGALFFFRHKFKAQLGFLFLAGSLLKFAIFFLVFYPLYNADGVLSKMEFSTFFTPYIVGLIYETLSLSKWLNNLD